jgi:hypothetical protein
MWGGNISRRSSVRTINCLPSAPAGETQVLQWFPRISLFKSESFTFPCQKTQESYEEHRIGIQFNIQFCYPSVKSVDSPFACLLFQLWDRRSADGISFRPPSFLCRVCPFLHTRRSCRNARALSIHIIKQNTCVRPWKHSFFLLIEKNLKIVIVWKVFFRKEQCASNYNNTENGGGGRNVPWDACVTLDIIPT